MPRVESRVGSGSGAGAAITPTLDGASPSRSSSAAAGMPRGLASSVFPRRRGRVSRGRLRLPPRASRRRARPPRGRAGARAYPPPWRAARRLTSPRRAASPSAQDCFHLRVRSRRGINIAPQTRAPTPRAPAAPRREAQRVAAATPPGGFSSAQRLRERFLDPLRVRRRRVASRAARRRRESSYRAAPPTRLVAAVDAGALRPPRVSSPVDAVAVAHRHRLARAARRSTRSASGGGGWWRRAPTPAATRAPPR